MAGRMFHLLSDNGLARVRQHRDCHVVIDGCQLEHKVLGGTWLFDFAGYAAELRRIFQCLLDANIEVHVVLPSGNFACVEDKIKQRQQKLCTTQWAARAPTRTKPLRPPMTANILEDIANEMNVEVFKTDRASDYRVEMAAYAKYLDAFILSGNSKFLFDDIPRGVLYLRKSNRTIFHEGICQGPTISYTEIGQRIRLDESRNPKALPMWLVMSKGDRYGDDVFKEYRNSFSATEEMPNDFVPSGNHCYLSFPSHRNDLRLVLNLLEFLLKHTAAETERSLDAKLFPGDRQKADRLLREACDAHDVPPKDIFRSIQEGFESRRYFEQEVPLWFLQQNATNAVSPLIPYLWWTPDCRYMLLPIFLEDTRKKCVHDVSLRLRRIAYTIAFGHKDNQLAGNEITEIGRTDQEVNRVRVAFLWRLWDPEAPDSPVELPSLNDVETTSLEQRKACFLLGLTVKRSLPNKIGSAVALFLTAVLKYWIHSAEHIRRKDLVNVLLSMLIIEHRHSKQSGIFTPRVYLRENTDVSQFYELSERNYLMLSKMHPFCQLESCLLFARTVHRLLLKPLGVGDHAMWEYFSERVFYNVADCTPSGGDHNKAMGQLLEKLMDRENRAAFDKTVDLIWKKGDIRSASTMLDMDAPNNSV